MQIAGSRVLLTGATGGLGRVIATALYNHGAELVLTGRNQDALQGLCEDLGVDRCSAIAADLSTRADVDELAAQAGRIDILIHNAGLPGSGRLESFSPEQVDRVLDVNLRTGVHLTHAFLPGMLERGRGHIVLMSSMAGKVPVTPLYSATKYGLRGFAGALRDDLHKTGVGVSAIFPGPIEDVGMQADSGIKTPNPKRYPSDVAEAVVKAIEKNRAEVTVADPIQRVGEYMAALAPATAARARRLVGLRKIVEATAEGQRPKR